MTASTGVSYQDIVQSIIDSGDSTATDIWIEQYLADPVSGFTDSEEQDVLKRDEEIYAYDGTSWGTIRDIVFEKELVYTDVNTTVDQWKELYYEDAENEAYRRIGEIIIRNENSPQYPIPDFASLNDGLYNSGGISCDSTSWISFEFPETNNVDSFVAWTDATSVDVYFAYSKNNIDWTYLKAATGHSLDSDNRMATASGQSDAETNYWTSTPDEVGKIFGKFPLGVRAKYVKMWVLTDAVNIYEMLYRYYVIPEQMVVDYLSALSADVGLLEAGVIQSTNFVATGGTKLDLDNDVFTVYDDQGTLRVKLGKLT